MDIKIKIPKNWYDINLQMFLDLRDLDKNVDKDSLKTNLEFISILTKIDTKDLYKLSTKSILELITDLTNITKEQIAVLKEPIFKLNKKRYILNTDIANMSVGQFIDLDIINKDGDVWENGHKIAASFMQEVDNTLFQDIKIYYKKLLRKKISINDYKLKEYNYDDLIENSKEFYTQMPMPYIYTCVTFFFEFRTNLIKQYEGLFPSTGREQEEEEDIKANKTIEEQFSERWMWYSIIRELCNGDLTRMDEITKLKLITVMNDLAYKKEKADIDKHKNNNNVKTY